MPEVLADLPERLKTAAATSRDAATNARLAREARDALIVQAVDEGMSQKAVAELAGFAGPAAVTHVLRRSHEVED